MDIQTIDKQYEQLQGQSQETTQQIKTLAGKLQAAAKDGNQDAREWLLDLKEVALAMKAEQNQVSNLLGALHNFVASKEQEESQQAGSVPQTQQPQGSPWGAQQQPQQAYPQQGYPPPQAPAQQTYPQQGYPPQPYPQQAYPQQAYPQRSGGMLGGFMNSGFGRAIAMGAGFGLGDDLINSIF